MNRKSADRIIVRSNDRMKLVIDWFYDNKSWLEREDFRAPLESGVVELQEERLEFTFEDKFGERVSTLLRGRWNARTAKRRMFPSETSWKTL